MGLGFRVLGFRAKVWGFKLGLGFRVQSVIGGTLVHSLGSTKVVLIGFLGAVTCTCLIWLLAFRVL